MIIERSNAMYYAHAYYNNHCRWCGKAYRAKKPLEKDGFCSNAHKMAHHKAYKKYVTAHSAGSSSPAKGRVTRKKAK